MLPLFISIDEDAFQHVFSPAAFARAPADDAIYLIAKPTPGDNVLTTIPEYSRLADMDRYDGRHRFALASISMDAIHSSAHEAGNSAEAEGFVVEIERKITIFRAHIVYEMRVNDASPKKKLHDVPRLMRFIRFLSAMAFTDIALIKARSEEQDKSPIIHLEIDSTSSTTDAIAFGIRYASHGFRERFLQLGCNRSVKLALPAIEPFDESNSELFERVRLKVAP